MGFVSSSVGKGPRQIARSILAAVLPELHRSQFMLGPAPYELAGWKSSRLANGLTLSFSEALAVQSATDNVGNEWTLVGFAVQTDPNAPDPIDALSLGSGRVEQITRTWTGRWILIGPDALHPDPSALLGCYYRTLEEGPLVGAWASSSLRLLADLPGSPPAGRREGDLAWGVGIDWYTPPGSRYTGIRRVLASQVLGLANGGLMPRRRSFLGTTQNPVDPERAVERVGQRLITAMQAIANASSGPPWIALTAGADSRLLLAAASAAGIEVKTYTQELPFHRWGHGIADRTLPPLLSKTVGYDHQLIKAKPPEDRLLELWDTHTDGQVVEADREFVARRQWNQIPAGSTIVRAGIFETAQCSKYPFLPAVAAGDSSGMFQGLADYADGLGRPLADHQVEALSEWLDWINVDERADMDWRDQFYHEQRIGGWLSSIEQGLDCTGRLSLQPANCSALLEELLAFDQNTRIATRHHMMLIEHLAPALLQYPINPDDSWPVRFAAKIVREGYRITRSADAGGYVRNAVYRLKHKLSK